VILKISFRGIQVLKAHRFQRIINARVARCAGGYVVQTVAILGYFACIYFERIPQYYRLIVFTD